MAAVMLVGCDSGPQLVRWDHGQIAVGSLVDFVIEDHCRDPALNCVDESVTEILEVTVDPAFVVEGTQVNPPANAGVTLRAVSAGATTMHVRTLGADGDERDFEADVEAFEADHVEVYTFCDSDRPLLLGAGGTLVVQPSFRAGGQPLGGYGYFPFEAENLTPMESTRAQALYLVPPSAGAARLTSPIDPGFALEATVFEASTVEAIDVRANEATIPLGGSTLVNAYASVGGREACVPPPGPWTGAIAPAGVCSFAYPAEEGDATTEPDPGDSPRFEVNAYGSGTCTVTVGVSGSAVTGAAEICVGACP